MHIRCKCKKYDAVSHGLCDVCIGLALVNLRELAEIMVDAELITRSRCHELTGMSHSEIGKLLANSPIAKDAAKQCINIANAHAYSCGCSGVIVADIVETFHLSV